MLDTIYATVLYCTVLPICCSRALKSSAWTQLLKQSLHGCTVSLLMYKLYRRRGIILQLSVKNYPTPWCTRVPTQSSLVNMCSCFILHVCVCVSFFHIFCRHSDHKSSDQDPISPWWVLLHGDFKWIFHHFPVELCACVRVCLHVCMEVVVYMSASACAVCTVCVSLFQWWQTVEVSFLEKIDNLSSGNMSQPFSTSSLQPAQTGHQSKAMCDNDTIIITFI